MKYALFLGCTVPSRGRNYEMAARLVAEKVGLELVDIPEFTCCGFPLRAVSFDTTILMCAKNLALAEKQGLNITTLCSACTSFQAEANHMLIAHEGLSDGLDDLLSLALSIIGELADGFEDLPVGALQCSTQLSCLAQALAHRRFRCRDLSNCQHADHVIRFGLVD